MIKALSLTTRGRLTEATAVIQKALNRASVVRGKFGGANALQAAVIALPDASAPVHPLPRATVVDSEPRGPVHEPVQEQAPAPAPATPRESVRRTGEAKTGFVGGSHAVGGTKRAYKLFVPERIAPSASLIVMLHGCTQGPDDFANGTRMNELAQRDGFLVLYPAQSRSGNASGCWNWFQPADQRRGNGEAGLIASLTRSIVEKYGIDPQRVHVAGLSAGGAMAANLAAEYPELFTAAGIHSGLVAGAAANVVDAMTAMRQGSRSTHAHSPQRPRRPTIVFHGDADRTVHPSNGDRIVAAALGDDPAAFDHQIENGVSSAGHAYSKHSYREADGVSVENWVLHGAGHAWAGGDAAGSYTDPQGVDASAEMLRFFKLQEARAERTAVKPPQTAAS